MNETQRALMEGERNAASDEYFGARPQIDTTDRRRVFEAGFDRAWKALLPTVCDCTTETHADGRQETRCGSDQMMRSLKTPNALAQADAACGVSPGAMGSASL